jgi:peptidoglycan pentaglycine glycine transferase (the first glycine)
MPAVKFIEDPRAWDDFVARSRKPHILQSWGWGELKSRTGWRPHRVAVERDGVWRVGVSALERDFPKIGRRFLYAPRGPLAAEEWRAGDFADLFEAMERLARARKAVFLKMDPDVSEEADWLRAPFESAGFRPAPETGGFSGVQPRCVFRLNIDRAEDEILKGMESKTRYNLRLSEKKGVRVRPVMDDGAVETFHRLLDVTARRDGFLTRPLNYFIAIRDLLGPRGQAQFFLAEKDGAALSGALALTMGPLCWYAYGASSNEERNLMPNYLMQWEMIRWARSKGCKTYDFRAVPSDPSPTDPLYGLYRFKKGFGGEKIRFIGEYDRVYSPLWYGLWTRGWPAFKKIRRLLKGPGASRAEND